ncbi:16S rRNA (adenine(1518)-N(6)/adenine(1519)-N(6))-dimethyltransferase RsmA [Campylobacter sp. LR291e]|uniref:16S rRNA (adenine(1518)-N(6)/adenine(1519)-N(6))- dimethyltransferase RsmA n=1 Tax=unclassified Campylobacter TaxID=2593542 RepID=UPI001239F765|nr:MULTISPECIES: 16S rRNA (adenine(1518)-N(6)/adenine(1519)-N(6))-dimethyltransferase RsmA [unclassified Campylobacter]KAA6231244.1 16S rRNA (adenine(1518)-N(6)/adenine(1519)-N(6))-dimethyltransferase RsmA [Campylobacter sp. LR291e]KAA6234133.1 16S rRNA (adenine(1518)-N(6)/adenine(1519)-N(6))-dimethyltransferase RsmA [Campylobacter sp. LR264d]
MIKAKKHYGQNFLCDNSILNRIIQAIPKDTKNIVEIGPGLGDLTQELLKICRVKAYEIDIELVSLLKDKFKNEITHNRLKLLHQDASEAFLPNLDDEKYFLVANLPYYIASHLVLKSLEDEHCLGLIVMIQKEMALKFCANEKDSDFCALSVLTSLLCKRKILFEVTPLCFNPPPKVMSAVVYMEKEREFKDFCELSSFKSFLRTCFKAPRKQLLRNLKPYKNELLNFFSLCKISENIRPHELDAKSYLKIYEKLKDKYERK